MTSSNNHVDVVYDDTLTNVEEMESQLNSGGYSVQGVIYPNRAPAADAGEDIEIEENTLVRLDGSGSSDPDNDVITYEWKQISGLAVSLSNAGSSVASFTAPEINQDEITLVFELKVSDPENLTSADEVVVTVTDVYQPPVHTDITPQEAKRMIDSNENAVILDVSGYDEYCNAHIPEAVNYSIDDGVLAEQYSNIPLSSSIIVVGADSQQSQEVASFLDGEGYLNVFDMTGGISAWEWETESCEDDIPEYPVAEAGEAQTVYEGQTVTLDGTGSFDPAGRSFTFAWSSTDAPDVVLSNAVSSQPYFVAPPAGANGATLTFRLEVVNSESLSHADTVSITVVDNGITELPDDITSIYTANGEILGIQVQGGDLVKLAPADFRPSPDNSGEPSSMPYGLLDMEIKTENPGDTAVVAIYLPASAPEGYRWYDYRKESVWAEFSSGADFNTARDHVQITLSDGGDRDHDGSSNGIITNASGLGVTHVSDDEPGVDSEDSGGGGGGCFIQSVSAGHPVKMIESLLDMFSFN